MTTRLLLPPPLLLGIALGGCAGPGEVEGPFGSFELRTALYRVSPVDVIVLLSNGQIPCGFPALPDPDEQAEALFDLQTAICREGAQHVVLALYDEAGSTPGGTYPGTTASDDGDLPAEPRTSSAFYYGIEEAFLADYQDLARIYLPTNDLYWSLGNGGTVDVATEDGHMTGWFEFPAIPAGGISGRFRATECTGDASALDEVDALDDIDPSFYCSLL